MKFVLELLHPDAGGEYDQTRDRTDYDRIDEWFQDRHHALVSRFVGTGGGVSDRRGALPRLVRIQAAINAAVEGVGECRAEEATGRGGARECVGEYRDERRNDIAQIRQYHGECTDQIDDCHGRHDGGRNLRDAGNATDDYQSQQHRQHARGDDGL